MLFDRKQRWIGNNLAVNNTKNNSNNNVYI